MQEQFYFGFRYEKELATRVRRYCYEEQLSLNDLVHEMLGFLAGVHDDGRLDLFESVSGFSARSDKEDIVSTSLTLSVERREMLRNLSYSYRMSMAEVIRLGLEMYLESQGLGGKLDKVIHTYRITRPLLHTVVTSLYPVLPEDEIPYPLLL